MPFRPGKAAVKLVLPSANAVAIVAQAAVRPDSATEVTYIVAFLGRPGVLGHQQRDGVAHMGPEVLAVLQCSTEGLGEEPEPLRGILGPTAEGGQGLPELVLQGGHQDGPLDVSLLAQGRRQLPTPPGLGQELPRPKRESDAPDTFFFSTYTSHEFASPPPVTAPSMFRGMASSTASGSPSDLTATTVLHGFCPLVLIPCSDAAKLGQGL